MMLDPLQFAYRHNRGAEEASLTLLCFIYKYLELGKTHALLLFEEFSTGFVTV